MIDAEARAMQIVLQVGEMHFEGNIIPQSWFEHLKYPSGKPYLIAIMILSEIVYWHRPREIRDERTGRVIGHEKKFAGDMLSRSYEAFGTQFGFSKREATDAIKYLVAEGIVRTELRTVCYDNRYKFPNVLYVSVNPERLREITYSCRFTDAPEGRKSSSARTEEIIRNNGGLSSVSTEDGVRRNGGGFDNTAEEEMPRNGRGGHAEPEGVARPAAVSSRAETPPPPTPRRKTNIENNIESILESGGERPATASSSTQDQALPYAARGAVGGRLYPRLVALAEWMHARLGRPLCDPGMTPDELTAAEEALDRLDGFARACGQSGEDVLRSRLLLRAEVQAQLRDAAVPYHVLARQLAWALDDYAERAARKQPGPAPALPPEPVATRRRPREKPGWMSDDEWAFYLASEG